MFCFSPLCPSYEEVQAKDRNKRINEELRRDKRELNHTQRLLLLGKLL